MSVGWLQRLMLFSLVKGLQFTERKRNLEFLLHEIAAEFDLKSGTLNDMGFHNPQDAFRNILFAINQPPGGSFQATTGRDNRRTPIVQAVADPMQTPRGVEKTSFRLLAIELDPGRQDLYHIKLFNDSLEQGHEITTNLSCIKEKQWSLAVSPIGHKLPIATQANLDEVISASISEDIDIDLLKTAAPYWPHQLLDDISTRRIAGNGVIAFDANWFLSAISSSAMDKPILLVGAAEKMNLSSLQWAQNVMAQCCRSNDSESPFVEVLQGVTNAAINNVLAAAADVGANDEMHEMPNPFHEGRLVAEWASGELAQVGTDVEDGLMQAVGRGQLTVHFPADSLLGIGLNPLTPELMGAEVAEVDPGGVAEDAGVRVGMVFASLIDPYMDLHNASFDAILSEIDARRENPDALGVIFDTAAPVSHLYAVEMEADSAINGFALLEDRTRPMIGSLPSLRGLGKDIANLCEASRTPSKDADTTTSNQFLWQEAYPRAFVGEPGSMTCCHVDLAPQLELLHSLSGTKFLGVASHGATPRLLKEHAIALDQENNNEEDDDMVGFEGDSIATRVPVDRPLTSRESSVLQDPDMNIVAIRPGDLLAFSSGAMHFATNGADGVNAAVYHGLITKQLLSRLKASAAKSAAEGMIARGRYSNHLDAAALLAEVEAGELV